MTNTDCIFIFLFMESFYLFVGQQHAKCRYASLSLNFEACMFSTGHRARASQTDGGCRFLCLWLFLARQPSTHLLCRLCTSPDAGFTAQKAPENIWRPSCVRTILSALPDSLAAKMGEQQGWEGKGTKWIEEGREQNKGILDLTPRTFETDLHNHASAIMYNVHSAKCRFVCFYVRITALCRQRHRNNNQASSTWLPMTRLYSRRRRMATLHKTPNLATNRSCRRSSCRASCSGCSESCSALSRSFLLVSIGYCCFGFISFLS